ncbi:hypothetical protein Q7C36_005471 [Tachysurus vachellii]|uniref:Uncharacterized protein n=1 Tax=Tachysurus vachellii TaxID=175792 RepID=A0AA88NQP2_TACVA|nr:hypothetical protein Q7C36_005471 [Tachysurus vachellii]
MNLLTDWSVKKKKKVPFLNRQVCVRGVWGHPQCCWLCGCSVWCKCLTLKMCMSYSTCLQISNRSDYKDVKCCATDYCN